MRRLVRLGAAAVVALCAGACGGGGGGSSSSTTTTIPKTITVTSSAFANGAAIPKAYTCDGAQTSPPLAWTGVPPDAAELALAVLDPDAPSGTFVHWTVTGIDAKTASAEEGKVPDGGVEHNTSRGKAGYVGMCPPSGTHHYHFVVYALSTKLQLPDDLSADRVVQLVETTAKAKGELIGTYHR